MKFSEEKLNSIRNLAWIQKKSIKQFILDLIDLELEKTDIKNFGDKNE